MRGRGGSPKSAASLVNSKGLRVVTIAGATVAATRHDGRRRCQRRVEWGIEEDGSQAAGVLFLEQPLAALDLLIVECANVLWAKAWRGVLRRDLAGAGEDRGSAGPVLAADSSIPRCLPSQSEP